MDVPNFVQMNPWKKHGFKPDDLLEFTLKPRFAYTQLKDFFYNTNLMIFIKGLRRLGKSTLMRQIIIDLLTNKNIHPDQINFIQFSESFFDLKKVLASTPPRSFLFLDEIQYCPRWRDALKQYYDANTGTKICFSGSAVLRLTKEKESLAGRFLPLNIKPLTFKEYLYLKYSSPKTANGPEDFYDYVAFGEFPETLKLTSLDAKISYLKDSLIDPILGIDVAQYGLEKKQEFSNIFKSLAANTSQITKKTILSTEIGISRPLVDKYLAILIDMGLIEILPNYLPSTRAQILSDKKIFFTSTNIVLSILNITHPWSLPTLKGQLIETYVYNQLKPNFSSMWYWRQQNREIDFIGTQNGTLHSFEVKSSEKINPPEIHMYAHYAQKLSATFKLLYMGPTNDHLQLQNITEL